jgi:hypothetical protein
MKRTEPNIRAFIILASAQQYVSGESNFETDLLGRNLVLHRDGGMGVLQRHRRSLDRSRSAGISLAVGSSLRVRNPILLQPACGDYCRNCAVEKTKTD